MCEFILRRKKKKKKSYLMAAMCKDWTRASMIWNRHLCLGSYFLNPSHLQVKLVKETCEETRTRDTRNFFSIVIF